MEALENNTIVLEKYKNTTFANLSFVGFVIIRRKKSTIILWKAGNRAKNNKSYFKGIISPEFEDHTGSKEIIIAEVIKKVKTYKRNKDPKLQRVLVFKNTRDDGASLWGFITDTNGQHKIALKKQDQETYVGGFSK